MSPLKIETVEYGYDMLRTGVIAWSWCQCT
jgi:hypothetical protein